MSFTISLLFLFIFFLVSFARYLAGCLVVVVVVVLKGIPAKTRREKKKEEGRAEADLIRFDRVDCRVEAIRR